MKSYKVEITKTYVLDIQADEEGDAQFKAEERLNEEMRNGTDHYYETNDSIYNVFDVTDTDDDAFNNDNK